MPRATLIPDNYFYSKNNIPPILHGTSYCAGKFKIWLAQVYVS